MRFANLIATIQEHHWPVYGLEIRKNGELLYNFGDSKDTRYPLYSATKSFVSTAAGITVTYLSDMQTGSEDLTEAVMECIKS